MLTPDILFIFDTMFFYRSLLLNIHIKHLYGVVYGVLSYIMVCSCSIATVIPDSLQPNGPQPSRLFCPWDFPGENNGVGCHALLQQVFPTQGSNPALQVYSLPSESPPGMAGYNENLIHFLTW